MSKLPSSPSSEASKRINGINGSSNISKVSGAISDIMVLGELYVLILEGKDIPILGFLLLIIQYLDGNTEVKTQIIEKGQQLPTIINPEKILFSEAKKKNSKLLAAIALGRKMNESHESFDKLHPLINLIYGLPVPERVREEVAGLLDIIV